jgi:hypothetical protein
MVDTTVGNALCSFLEDTTTALLDFQAAIQLNPTKAEAHFYLGEIQQALHQDPIAAWETYVNYACVAIRAIHRQLLINV